MNLFQATYSREEGTCYTLEELDQIGKKEGAHSTAVAPKSMDEGVSFTAEEVGRHLAVDKTGGKDAA